jgi:hypothetical protein
VDGFISFHYKKESLKYVLTTFAFFSLCELYDCLTVNHLRWSHILLLFHQSKFFYSFSTLIESIVDVKIIEK